MERPHPFLLRNGQINREGRPDGIAQDSKVEIHPTVLVRESRDSPQIYQLPIGEGIEVAEDVSPNPLLSPFWQREVGGDVCRVDIRDSKVLNRSTLNSVCPKTSLVRHAGLDPASRDLRKHWIPAFAGMTLLY